MIVSRSFNIQKKKILFSSGFTSKKCELKCSTGYLDLTNQPESDLFGFHETLTDVDLTGNRLRSLPGQIAIVTSLRRLSLRQNLLGDQPESLSILQNLTAITSLDLYDNDLQKCPELTTLRSLTMLDLSFNKVSSISFRPGNDAQYRVFDL